MQETKQNTQQVIIRRVGLTLADWNIFCCHPPVDNHSGMMIHMKEGNLVVLLSQDEKYL